MAGGEEPATQEAIRRCPYAGVPRRGKGLAAPWLGSQGPWVPAPLPLGRTQHSSKVLPKPSTPPRVQQLPITSGRKLRGSNTTFCVKAGRESLSATEGVAGTHMTWEKSWMRDPAWECVCGGGGGLPPGPEYPTRRPPFFECHLHHLSCGVLVGGQAEYG